MAYASANTTYVRPNGHYFADVVKAFADWKLYRRTLADLRKLSRAELADLGISRFELPSIARELVRVN